LNKARKVLVISQYFYPESFRINDLCAAWVSLGYEVSVVTGIPNYPKGRFFKGYGWFHRTKENYQGVSVRRLPIVSRGKGFFRLGINYVSFVVSGLLWAKFTKQTADVVFINEVSPMTQALPGIWYAKRKQIPVFLYVQDLWPENIEATIKRPSGRMIQIIDRLVRHIYRSVDVIFTSSQAYIDNIIAKGIDPLKLHYWPQYAEEFYTPLEPSTDGPIPQSSALKVIFTGNIGKAQGLQTLLQAARELKDYNIEFYLVGDGSEKQSLVEEYADLDFIHFIDAVPATEIPKYLAQCDFAYISLLDQPIYGLTIPAKLQSYLACGIPVVASATGEVERIINEASAGFVAPPEQVKPLVDIFRECVTMKDEEKKNLQQNARNYYEANFKRDVLLNQMNPFLMGEYDEH
jgi:glycosyltransferase involved in cell wall biosynthesis